MSLSIRNLQDSHFTELEFARSSRQDLERFLAILQNIQEHQSRTYEVVRDIRYSLTRSTVRGLTERGGQPPSIQHRQLANTNASSPLNQSPAIAYIKVQQVVRPTCRQICSCQCHTPGQWRSYRLLDQALGSLFIGYSRTPTITLKCDLKSCNRHQRGLVTALYVFPQWFLQRALSVVLVSTKRNGLTASLRTIRCRSSSDMVFHYVATGDITRLQTLFDKGEASPSDVIISTQLSVLQVRAVLSRSMWALRLIHS